MELWNVYVDTNMKYALQSLSDAKWNYMYWITLSITGGPERFLQLAVI